MFFTAFPSGSLIQHYIFHKCSIFRQISGWDGLHWRPPQPKIWGGVSPCRPPRGLRPCDDLTKNWNHVSISRTVCVCLGNFLWLIWCSSMVYQRHFCTYDRGEKSTTGGPTRLTNKQFDVLWTVKRTGCALENKSSSWSWHLSLRQQM